MRQLKSSDFLPQTDANKSLLNARIQLNGVFHSISTVQSVASVFKHRKWPGTWKVTCQQQSHWANCCSAPKGTMLQKATAFPSNVLLRSRPTSLSRIHAQDHPQSKKSPAVSISQRSSSVPSRFFGRGSTVCIIYLVGTSAFVLHTWLGRKNGKNIKCSVCECLCACAWNYIHALPSPCAKTVQAGGQQHPHMYIGHRCF